ncbi:MAG: succinylglutamate desuccinylase/aspartoacylase family protein, partial [Rhodobacteraceae bacterium]|nr:succinylglutamate desuccinylase/aspartoacylase family protein [Paracoccaceae bacterium]
MAAVTAGGVTELAIRDSLPAGFLDCPARELAALLGGPTLIELAGRREPPLFVSVIQHGNETTGLEAVQQVLRARLGADGSGGGLPRSLMLFVGNVAAAAQGLRRLDGQPDYNRAWPGTVDHAGTPEAAMMAQVHARIVARDCFAAIDLHNNTGLNPPYGVVCSDDADTLHLAAMFARTAIRFRGIAGTQTASLAGRLPAIAAECSQPGVAANAALAASFVNGMLALAAFPERPPRPDALAMYHTMGVVRVREEVSFAFGD